jgi:ribosomal protein S18 acetylase RimI-like enzyme
MTLEIVSIPGSGSRLAEPLGRFFQSIQASTAGEHFHPHTLDRETAARIACYAGDDLYYALVDAGGVLGYGILRGWDEGFDVPSLGIALLESARGAGLGEMLMHFLHGAARLKGAERVRLTVDEANKPALSLYRKLGYAFEPLEAGRLVGYREV